MKKIDYEIIYKTEYFNRGLFLLKIGDKYTKVYTGSGLNGGKVGRVLPFTTLMDRKPRGFSEIMSGLIPGYIYKEFFFEGKYVAHFKEAQSFSTGISNFLRQLEEELNKEELSIQNKDYDMDTIIPIVLDINKNMNIYSIKEEFDWGVL